MATAKQIEANRKNAARSTGPRSDAGKLASRVNAIKHGLRAELIDVLPHEDAALYEELVGAWMSRYRPMDAVEEGLVRYAASLSWKLDRARGHETAVLTRRGREAREAVEKTQAERLEDAIHILCPRPEAMFDRGPTGVYYLPVREQLEATSAGCRLLINHWERLREIVRSHRSWDELELVHAMRLMANQPISFTDEPRLLDMAIASRRLHRPDVAVTTLMLIETRGNPFSSAIMADACARQPRSRAEARQVLVDMTTAEIERLQSVLDEREALGDPFRAELKEADRVASFDPSTEGARVRNYQSTLHRELLRTLDMLTKLQKERRANDEGTPAPNEANSDHIADASTPEPDVPDPQLGGAPAPNEANFIPIVQEKVASEQPRSVAPVPRMKSNQAMKLLKRLRKGTDRQRALAKQLEEQG
ncbi:MAG: hypothetical protein ABS79_01780 [Planctomycetes bacterium SCN 63-9]|nr:MAG: hypothetical protein ABS79_01780 [Planctomycetes bacterium SCN 63-9]